MKSKIFQLENKLIDTKALADKFESDLKLLQKKYDDIHQFIYDSRTVTIRKDHKH